MKKCKACQKEIDPKASKCPYCQADQRNWFARHKILTGFLSLIVLIIILAIAGSGKSSSSKQSVPAASDQSATPPTTQTNNQPAATPAVPQTLLDISGSGSKSTQKFTAGGDWDMNWSYDCSKQMGAVGGQGNFQVMVYNGDGSLSFQNTAVNQLGKSDAETEHHHSGGTFYLEVNSECNWKIQVKG